MDILLEQNSSKVYEDSVDWVIVDQMEGTKVDYLLGKKSSKNLLKISDLPEGPVLGLGFNKLYNNILAASSKSSKLNIYYIDSHFRHSATTELVDLSSKDRNDQVMFIDWNPFYAAILATTRDVGITTFWDIRHQHPILSCEEKGAQCTKIHWDPKNPVKFAVSTIGEESSTVKIWDARNLRFPLAEFGPETGVRSLSWSSANDLILTTDVNGGLDCWKVNGDRTNVNLCGGLRGAGADCFWEARWCEPDNTFAAASTSGVEFCKFPKSPVAI